MWFLEQRTNWRRLVAIAIGAVLLVASIGCGGDGGGDDGPSSDECSSDPFYYETPACLAGLRVSLRYGDQVLVNPQDWELYSRVLEFVYRESPLTELAMPSGVGAQRQVAIETTHAPILAAWTSGEIATGDPVVDNIFVGTASGVLDWGLTIDGLRHSYAVQFASEASVDVLSHRVGEIPDTLLPPPVRPHNDTAVSWSGDVATVDLVGGWEDCFAGCQYYHYWTATVDVTTETVEVQDLGGDVIPDWIYEAFGLPVP
jgi:hypothetical protein